MTANRTGRGLTRGRLAPFNCGHRGWGVECHRCAQGNQMLARAEELASLVKDGGKTTRTPEWVELPSNENKGTLSVSAGGHRFAVVMTSKMTGKDAMTQVVVSMKQESKRMFSRPTNE